MEGIRNQTKQAKPSRTEPFYFGTGRNRMRKQTKAEGCAAEDLEDQVGIRYQTVRMKCIYTCLFKHSLYTTVWYRLCMYIHICIYAYIYIYMYACVYIYTYIHICLCVYI